MPSVTGNTLPSQRTFENALSAIKSGSPIPEREKAIRQHIHAMNVLLLDQHLYHLRSLSNHLTKGVSVLFRLAPDGSNEPTAIRSFADHAVLVINRGAATCEQSRCCITRFVKRGPLAPETGREIAASLVDYASAHLNTRGILPDSLRLEPVETR